MPTNPSNIDLHNQLSSQTANQTIQTSLAHEKSKSKATY
jgi:hypothetical protein